MLDQKTLKMATDIFNLDIQKAYQQGREDTIDEFKTVFKEAEELHPYKIVGNADSYSQYNEGWQDAIDYISSRLEI